MYLPRVTDELRQWAEDGLIDSFSHYDLADAVVAQVLQVVRNHILEQSDEPAEA
jgi:hypothetical protein